jgi:chorismate-pyruvate lyase
MIVRSRARWPVSQWLLPMMTMMMTWAITAAHAQAPPATPTPAPMPQPAWPDDFLTRVEALALLQTLNSELLSHDSATLTLERWCEAHHLATPAQISAQRVREVDKPAGDEERTLLHVTAEQSVRYRRVRLVCGGIELSVADNWYVPDRLTAQMNAQLDNSDTPFGKVVRELNFQRHTLSSTLLWWPLPANWEMGAALPAMGERSLSVPAAVLEHRAVLTLPDGTPFSAVVETYSGNLFAFGPLSAGNTSKRH